MVMPSEGIQPGSVPYGERGQLAAAVDGAGQGQGDAAAVPAATSGSAGVGGPLDPLQAMLTGGVPPSEDPITSGLTRGPGLTPAPQTIDSTPAQKRLIYIAQNAKSPNLRIQARLALRQMAQQKGR